VQATYFDKHSSLLLVNGNYTKIKIYNTATKYVVIDKLDHLPNKLSSFNNKQNIFFNYKRMHASEKPGC
jgi:hypothetical protein